MEGLFQKYSKLSHWPLGILLKMFFLRREYIREFCCYCGKTLKFSRSTRSGDSGGICVACFLKKCPEVYFEMKEQGKLTPEQISEAEEPLLIKL